MNIRAVLTIVVFLILTAMLNIGTIRREENPIRKTQTDPIAYKKKMEEIKDGEKGAPAPKMVFYEKEKFQTDLPVETEEAQSPQNVIPQMGEPLPEDYWSQEDAWWEDDIETEADEDWWNVDEDEEFVEDAWGDAENLQDGEEEMSTDEFGDWWEDTSNSGNQDEEFTW